MLFAQHPLGHDAASQTQDPPTHACPCGHALPAWHTHPPAAVHVSALMPQAVQAPPFAPHARAEGVVHVWAEQHPPGHVVPLQFAHEPALQMRPPQSPHVAPPAPHA